jgi:hypothetical protein
MCNALSAYKAVIRDQPMAVMFVCVCVCTTQLTRGRSHYFPTVSLLSLGTMYSYSKTYESDSFFLVL